MNSLEMTWGGFVKYSETFLGDPFSTEIQLPDLGGLPEEALRIFFNKEEILFWAMTSDPRPQSAAGKETLRLKGAI
jgi:hypothetical protein